MSVGAPSSPRGPAACSGVEGRADTPPDPPTHCFPASVPGRASGQPRARRFGSVLVCPSCNTDPHRSVVRVLYGRKHAGHTDKISENTCCTGEGGGGGSPVRPRVRLQEGRDPGRRRPCTPRGGRAGHPDCEEPGPFSEFCPQIIRGPTCLPTPQQDCVPSLLPQAARSQPPEPAAGPFLRLGEMASTWLRGRGFRVLFGRLPRTDRGPDLHTCPWGPRTSLSLEVSPGQLHGTASCPRISLQEGTRTSAHVTPDLRWGLGPSILPWEPRPRWIHNLTQMRV